MLYRDICKILGIYLFGFTIALLIPTLLSIYFQFFSSYENHPQPHTSLAFIVTTFISTTLGFICYHFGKHSTGRLYRKEGLALVTLIWFISPFIGGLPFYLSGTLTNPVQAFFEASSGLTTTGATTMAAKQYDDSGDEIPIKRSFCGVHTTNYEFYGTIQPIKDPKTGKIVAEGIEAVGKALLFWRSFMQWLGGMGIVVLFVAILPALGAGGKFLFQAESPGPIKESITPRIKETASNLWKIYLGITFAEIALLMLTNSEIDLFEASTITFSTISTGGFTVKNTSIGFFQNVMTENIVILFMIIGSINFSLYFYALKGKFFRFNDPELILYIFLLVISCSIAAWYLIGQPKVLIPASSTTETYSVSEAIRYATFQVVSAQTSTGFTTANYDIWPYAAQAILLIIMFVGGMSGSTAGGMKVARHLMVFKIVQYKVESLFRPEAVRKLKIGQKEVGTSTVNLVMCYFVIVISIGVFSTLAFVFNGIDPETSIGLVACMMNNIGIGFRMDGPTESCAFLSNFDLILSSVLMIIGRLEFFAVLAILVPAFWKKYT